MRIAIIGSRGFLTDYGGFETLVRRLALGLKKKDYEVTVYGLRRYHNTINDDEYPGVRRVWVPSIGLKYLEKVSATLLSTIHATFSKNEIILLLGVSSALLVWLPLTFGKKIVVNIDGIEWQRNKWPRFVSFFLFLSEVLCVKLCHLIVADSKKIADYIKVKYGRGSIFIPYGAETNNKVEASDKRILAQYGLRAKRYFIQVCRLEPENNCHVVIGEFINYSGDKEMVIIGDTPHSVSYKKRVMNKTDGRVKFLGAIYGGNYRVLLRNAYCYVHGHEAGGTNPALLEAMASERCPLVLDVPYNREVIADCGMSFNKKPYDLLRKLQIADKNPVLVKSYGKYALRRVNECYTWKKVIADYDEAFRALCRHHGKEGFKVLFLNITISSLHIFLSS